MFLIGAVVALIGNAVVITVEKITEWKYSRLRDLFDKCSTSVSGVFSKGMVYGLSRRMRKIVLPWRAKL